MPADQANPSLGVRQETRAGRDAYVPAGNQTVINVNAGPSSTPDPPRWRVWGNVPPRNPGFTGRKKQLAALHRRLLAGGKTVVQALYGMGGVGKTQLAVEYAHLHAAEYDLVWWIAAEQPGLIGEQLAALADELGAPSATRRAILSALRERDHWLLVFDTRTLPKTSRRGCRAAPGMC